MPPLEISQQPEVAAAAVNANANDDDGNNNDSQILENKRENEDYHNCVKRRAGDEYHEDCQGNPDDYDCCADNNLNDDGTTMKPHERDDGVAFQSCVTTRAYDTVLGYHPDTHDGPPIQLGWRHVSQCTVLQDADGKHKSIHYIPKEERVQQLREYGYTVEQMDDAIAEVQRIHSSRVQSKNAAVVGRASASSAVSASASSRRRSSSGSSYKVSVKKSGSSRSRGRLQNRRPTGYGTARRGSSYSAYQQSVQRLAGTGGAKPIYNSVSVKTNSKKSDGDTAKPVGPSAAGTKKKKTKFLFWRS